MPATGVIITTSVASPQRENTAVVLTAQGSGASDYEYEFWVNPGTGWSRVQAYGPENTYALPLTLWAGTYTYQANCREAGSGVLPYEATATIEFQITTAAGAVRLEHSRGVVNFRSGSPRPERGLQMIQPKRTSAAGIPFGFAPTIVDQPLTVIQRMTAAERLAFLSFFNDIAAGQSEEFQLVDFTGTQSVRFGAPHIDDPEEIAYNTFRATIPYLRVGLPWGWW